MFAGDHDLALVFEIDRYPTADVGLDLPQTPVGTIRVAHEHSRFQHRVRIVRHGKVPVMDDRQVFSPEDLAALVGSRLCHDLVNPLGAIGNGVELLGMTGAAGGPEMTLIADAVRDAQARVRFFRIAFGAPGDGQIVRRREVAEVLEGLFGAGRLGVTWAVEADLSRTETRLALLMVNCAEAALPMGGEVTLAHRDHRLHLEARAPRVAIEPGLWRLLDDPAARVPVRPAQVQFPLLRDAAFAQDRPPQHEAGEDWLKVSV